MAVDIVGIGNQQMKYPDAVPENFEGSFEEYLVIAKKTIKTFASRFRAGLAEEMMRSEDAISNVATAIMMADWRWTPNYRSRDDKVRSKRSYRNQCAIWAIQAYMNRQSTAKHLTSLDSLINADGDYALKDMLPSKAMRPDAILIAEEEMCELRDMLASPTLTDQQRKYIELYYLDDKTLQEIADEAGSSREAVRQTIERGINKIKQLGVTI